MGTPKQRRVIGSVMVAIGLLQAVYGGLSGHLFYGLLGLAYALSGAAYLWLGGYATDQ